MRKFIQRVLIALLIVTWGAIHAQVPTRWAINGGFEDFIINGIYTAGGVGPGLLSTNCAPNNRPAAPANGYNGFVATINNNSNPIVQVAGWRSTDGNAVNAALGISTAGVPGGFNNCNTINNSSGWAEIFQGDTTGTGGVAQAGLYYNHNNPGAEARTYQQLCILPNDTPYYGISVRGRNDINERIALGIWTQANSGVFANSTAASVAGNAVGGNQFAVDLAITSRTAWTNATKATNPFPGLVGANSQIPNTWTGGIYGVGMQSSNGSGGGAGNFAGNPLEGGFGDSFFWDISPLIDLAGFTSTPATTVTAATVVEGNTTTLGVRVNGRLRTAASAILRYDATIANRAIPGIDYTIGAANRGSATLYTTTQTVAFGTGTINVFPGDIKLDLPTGDYDPNRNGTQTIGGFITIPFDLINDAVIENAENLRYTLGNTAAVSGTDVTDVTGGGDARFDTGLAVSKGNQSTLCSVANKAVTLQIIDNDKPTLSKAFAQNSIALGGTVTLIFTISSPQDPSGTNRVTATSINFTDNAPGTGANGLQFVAGSPVTTSTGCVGGTFNTSLTSSFSVTGVGVSNSPSPGTTTCQITVQMTNRVGSALNTACTTPTTGPANFLNTSITGTNTASIGGTTTATLSPISVAACLNVVTPVDVGVTKSITPTAAANGQTLAFTITFFNKGPNPVPLSGFVDTLPAQITTNLANVTSSVTGAATTSNFTLLGSTFSGSLTLPVNSTVTIRMVATATAVVATYTNTVALQLTNTVADSTPGDLTTTAVGSIWPAANLQITKTNGTLTLVAGATTAYTITVSNFGPDAANNAVLTDPVVPGLSCTSAATCTGSGGASCAATIAAATLQAGYTVPTFPANSTITVVYSCGVLATGQ